MQPSYRLQAPEASEEKAPNIASIVEATNQKQKSFFRVTNVLTDCFMISLTINETLKTPAQVMTSWSLHRGLVTLHTAGSLGLSNTTTPTDTPKPVSATAARRGSYAGNNSELCERAFRIPLQNVTLRLIHELCAPSFGGRGRGGQYPRAEKGFLPFPLRWSTCRVA